MEQQWEEDALGLYQRCMTGVVECLQRQMRLKVRRSIYTTPVVVWLMILQRLQPCGTLASSVEGLLSGVADALLSRCERARKKLSIAWQAQQRGLHVVIRLTHERARKLAGEPVSGEGERAAQWIASRFDGRRQGGMPQGASLPGRLIAARIGRGKSKTWLYLFTTLALPQDEVVALYGKRYRIETDLRALKRTVRLHHLAVRKESMMEKELLLAVAAYNLVRAVMALAARRHDLEPRQLSFTFVRNVVNAFRPRLQAATGEADYRDEVLHMLDAAAQGVHPKRKKRRSFPRAVWHRRHTFPACKEHGDSLT